MPHKRQPLHDCPRCGARIGALKKYCAPCADVVMREQSVARARRRRRRWKELKDAAAG